MNNQIAVPTPYRAVEVLEVSDSSLSLLHSCPRKFEMRKMFMSDRYENSLASSSGTALHASCQSYCAGKSKEQSIFNMLMEFPFEYDKGEMDVRSWQSCVHMAETAMEFWDTDMADWEIALIADKDGNPIPAYEVPFALVIENFPFYADGRTITLKYIGYIDLILHNKVTGQYAVCDIKTTVADLSKKVYEFTFADQCLPYGLVLETLLGQNIKQGFEVYYWMQYIHPIDATNQLLPFIKSHDDIQDWVVGFMEDVNTIKRSYNAGWFRRRGKSCYAWNRPCTYFDLCDSRNTQSIAAFVKMENSRREPSGNQRVKPWIEIKLETSQWQLGSGGI